jgi:uncharacterized protein with HEPN domain
MHPKAPKLLEDIRDAPAFVLEAAKGRTIDDYRRDRLLRQASERNFEIIGEAVNRIARLAPTWRQASESIGRSSRFATS